MRRQNGEASRAVYLLLTDDEDVAGGYAMELVSENARRQELEAKTLQEALLPENLKSKDEDLVVIAVGKLASRRYRYSSCKAYGEVHKPAIVLAYEEDWIFLSEVQQEVWKGSTLQRTFIG